MSSTPTHPSAQPTGSTPRRSTPRRSTPLLDRLDGEWAMLCARRATRRAVRTWMEEGLVGLPAGTADIESVLRATSLDADSWRAADGRLRELVVLAATDDLAARIVIQRLLPGLVTGARRWRASGGTEPLDFVIGAAWIAVRDFDPSRTARQIAPALISDSLWIGLRRDARRRSHDEIPIGHDSLASRPAGDPVIDATTALAATIRAARRAGVPGKDIELLRTLARVGSPAAVAAERGVTARTIRNHRDIAVHEVRRALGPDWIDWTDPLTAVA